MKKKYASMWNHLELKIVGLSSNKYFSDHPGINLLTAIIIQAAKDRDYIYFNSPQYKYHCWLLRMNKEFIFNLMKKAIAFEDSGEPWTLTEELEEDEWLAC